MSNPTPMSPVLLSRYLGQQYPPTDQQAAVIGAEPGPLLVVAGAGAGKTETMAARVVWLVANGYARPDEVLGLTFTRKAAQEMGKRIRDRLGSLAANTDLVRRLDPSGELAKNLEVIAPSVSTYDSYAGELIREYGLLVPVEPDARLITDAELHAIATDVVVNFSGGLITELGSNPSLSTVVEDLLALTTAMGNELASPEWVREHAHDFLAETESYPMAPRARVEFTKVLTNWRSKQEMRVNMLPLVEELAAELRRRGVVTFNEQMSVAAKLARDHQTVGESQRSRYRVVMLDEYQDTSHAQRVLLRSLFGEGADPSLTVTAVGDPMQAIYGWRGATAANLAAFVEDFPSPWGSSLTRTRKSPTWRTRLRRNTRRPLRKDARFPRPRWCARTATRRCSRRRWRSAGFPTKLWDLQGFSTSRKSPTPSPSPRCWCARTTPRPRCASLADPPWAWDWLTLKRWRRARATCTARALMPRRRPPRRTRRSTCTPSWRSWSRAPRRSPPAPTNPKGSRTPWRTWASRSATARKA